VGGRSGIGVAASGERGIVQGMSSVQVELSAELLALAQGADPQPSRAAAKLIALELFRERRISLGKAAELAGMALEEFMDFSAQREVSLNYTPPDWEADHSTARALGR